MQPAPTERSCFLQTVLGGFLLAVFLAGTAGCTDTAGSTQGYSPFGSVDTIAASEAPRDSILALLSRMNRAAFDSAFAHLDDYAFTRRVRTEQLDTTGTPTASRTLTIRYPPGSEPGSVQAADSSGSFRRGGALSSIAPANRRSSRPENLVDQSLEDQPAYLAPRTREAYRYALRQDALRDGTPVYIIEAKARSWGQGAEQGIRYARLTIDRESLELVGLTSARASRILLFREDSLVKIRMQRAPGGGADWLPDSTRFRAEVDVPLRSPRQFRTVSKYFDYEAR